MSATLAACLTPPGVGAIAVIGIRGTQALTAVQAHFQPAISIRPGGVYFGKFGETTSDEVVLVIQQVEPIPQVELHCHGGRAVVRMILDTLAASGIRIASWEEMLGQTEASLALARAATVRTANLLLDQHHGALAREVDEVLAALERQDVESAGARLQALAERIPLGRHLTTPWRVVVAGAPNVGKSSLVNALAGYSRSVVSPTPGTTRDLVGVTIALDGWPIELCDTAGQREGTGELEAAGIQLAQAAARAADLCVWVVDSSADPVWPAADLPHLAVISKIDLPPAWDFASAEAHCVSAVTGAGLVELGQAIANRLVPRPPPAGAGIPFTPRLADAIAAAWECLQSQPDEPPISAVASILQGITAKPSR